MNIYEKAHSIVSYNLNNGKLKLDDKCAMCGSEWGDLRHTIRLIAHHEDYNKPLEVTGLCMRCHWKLHRDRSDIWYIGGESMANNSPKG